MHLAALGLVWIMLHCMTVEIVVPTEMLRTGFCRTTKLALHIAHHELESLQMFSDDLSNLLTVLGITDA